MAKGELTRTYRVSDTTDIAMRRPTSGIKARRQRELTRAYRADDETDRALGDLVVGFKKNPGKFIGPHEFDDRRVNFKDVIRTLPPKLSEEQFIDVLHLAMLTECATDVFATQIVEGANKHKAPWLEDYADNLWRLDESTHAAPYKKILMAAGFSEAELDRKIRETREKTYDHKGGKTPPELVAYGALSELATDKFHGIIAEIFKPGSPDGAYITKRIGGRETKHRVWYTRMMRALLTLHPEYIEHFGETILNFNMPGASIAPELQAQAGEWLDKMGYDYQQASTDFVRIIYESTRSPAETFKLLFRIAAERGESTNHIPLRLIREVHKRFGSPGAGALGAGILDAAGLGHLMPKPQEVEDPYEKWHLFVANRIRNWGADHLQVDLKSRTMTKGKQYSLT